MPIDGNLNHTPGGFSVPGNGNRQLAMTARKDRNSNCDNYSTSQDSIENRNSTSQDSIENNETNETNESNELNNYNKTNSIGNIVKQIVRKNIEENQTKTLITRSSPPAIKIDENGNQYDDSKYKWATIPIERQTEKYKQKTSGYLIVSIQNNEWKITTSNYEHFRKRLKKLNNNIDINDLTPQLSPIPQSIEGFQSLDVSHIKIIVRIPISEQMDHKSLWKNINDRSVTFMSNPKKGIMLRTGVSVNEFLMEIIRISYQLGGIILWPRYINHIVQQPQISNNQYNSSIDEQKYWENYDYDNF